MSQILREIEPETVVVFDLDNTVVMASQMLGSDMWYDYLADKFTKEGLAAGMTEAEAKKEAIPKAIAGWMPYQRVTHVDAVEKDTPKLIADLQKQGLVVFGLTARPLELASASGRQLASVGVDFLNSRSLPKQMKGFTPSQAIAWRYGVIFVGPGNDKGEVLKTFLNANGIAHKKIVFVDDKTKNVNAVEKAFAQYRVPVVSFRYGAADPQVRAFDAGVAELQRDLYGKILSDELAKTLIEGQSKRL